MGVAYLKSVFFIYIQPPLKKQSFSKIASVLCDLVQNIISFLFGWVESNVLLMGKKEWKQKMKLKKS